MTRGILHFMQGEDRACTVYLHGDGYPDGKHGVLNVMKRFFKENKRQNTGNMYGTRFEDAFHLAPRFIVWQSIENRNDMHRVDKGMNENAPMPESLEFISICLVPHDWDDYQHAYVVDCEKLDDNGFPTVTEEPSDGS